MKKHDEGYTLPYVLVILMILYFVVVAVLSSAEATVTAVEGKVITFDVKAFDEAGEIGHGTHKRVIINSQKFLERTYSKL